MAIKNGGRRAVVLGGTIFMGFLGSVFIYNSGADSTTHLEEVYHYYLDMSLFEFLSDVGSLLILQPVETSNDLYKHIISYVAGSVFGIPELIHVFGGLLFGYFFTKSVLLVLESKPRGKLGLLLISFILVFLVVRSISALNSLRMWTAMWVFFYGALAYAKRGQGRYLWIIALSIFIHFSYLLFSLPLLAAIVLRRHKYLVAGIFIASFFINVGFQQVSRVVDATGLYENKLGSNVIDQEEFERRSDQNVTSTKQQNFYREFGPLIYKKFSVLILAIALILVYINSNNPVYLDSIIATGLLLLSLSNVAAATSPSVSGRGSTIAATFLVASAIQVIFILKQIVGNGFKTTIIKMLFSVFLISAIPHILFHLSYAFNTVSFFIITTPMVSWVLGNDDFSIRDFLAYFLF